MSTRPCSYEIQPPVEEAELSPARTHRDPEVYARMAAIARGHSARRFGLCRYQEPGLRGSSNVFCEYLGWRYRDGVTVTDHAGRPVGWYTSIDTAHHYLTAKRNTSLWLVWLEADYYAPDVQGAAGVEAAQQDPDLYVATVPFMAAGPHDARLLAVRLMEAAQSFLPEVQRQLVNVGNGSRGVMGVYCSQFGCIKPPQHAGGHDIPRHEAAPHRPPRTGPDDRYLTDAERAVIAEAARERTTADAGDAS